MTSSPNASSSNTGLGEGVKSPAGLGRGSRARKGQVRGDKSSAGLGRVRLG